MQKAEKQHQQTQTQLVEQQGKRGMVAASPQSERIAQFETLAGNSPQALAQAQLASMIHASPRMTAQRRMADMIHNSPLQAAQRKVAERIHNGPHLSVQRKTPESKLTDEAPKEGAGETLQSEVAQREEVPAKPNNTGLPDNLKSGIESLSGMSLDNVRVHYNSPQPSQLNAHAYAQGTDIHVAPGQEQHLPHEAWHVVQQAQGRVQPTMQMMQGVPVNDDKGLEHEADVMGARATSIGDVQRKSIESESIDYLPRQRNIPTGTSIQRKVIQMGGSKWTEHSGRELIEKRWEKNGFACFLTTDGKSHYVEAWRGEKDNLVYAGAVQLDPKGEALIMHTRSENGMDGGLAIVMMNEAVKVVAGKFAGFEYVQMTPAPGAASKKVIEMLSATVGNRVLHEQAMEIQKIRKDWEKEQKGSEGKNETEEERGNRLQTWSPHVLPEHLLHLESLVASDNREGIQISGPAGGLIGFDEEAIANPEKHTEVISQDPNASGYGIYIPMDKFLQMAERF